MTKNPAVDTAKDQRDPLRVRENPDGIRYRLHPVSPALMDAVTSRVKLPTVPMWYDKDTDRDVPNPNHPDYMNAVDEANRKRGIAVYDALIMFGVELVDGMPQDESWLAKLNAMAKHNLLDLGEYDLQDPLDKEFLYKRFILASNEVMTEVSELSTLTAADVKAAGASFPGNT